MICVCIFAEGASKIQRSSDHFSPSLDVLEAGTSVEHVKVYLQHVIQARKPPSLLGIPSTPPLFHMVSRQWTAIHSLYLIALTLLRYTILHYITLFVFSLFSPLHVSGCLLWPCASSI